MIIFVPDPQEIINTIEYMKTVQIQLPSGGFVNAEPLAYNQIRIIGVVSTDPMDYMDERYQPGMVVTVQ